MLFSLSQFQHLLSGDLEYILLGCCEGSEINVPYFETYPPPTYTDTHTYTYIHCNISEIRIQLKSNGVFFSLKDNNSIQPTAWRTVSTPLMVATVISIPPFIFLPTMGLIPNGTAPALGFK